MGITESHNCSFCNAEKDSIEHIFWRCNHIRTFWNTFEEKIREKCPTASNLSLTENIVLFGTDREFHSDSIFDFILLLAKHYIYQCKAEKHAPLFSVFSKCLKTRYAMEKHIAKVNMESERFELNWASYRSLLQLEDS